MPERRLAITLKGAISLGAYEAGAICQTLELIAYNNSHGIIPWYIDAMCGASAGSLTAALTAAALIRGDDADLLRQIWVSGVQLESLAPAADADDFPNTLLDAHALDTIAGEYLTFPKIVNRHPALRPAPSDVRLRFTLSQFAPFPIVGDTLNGTEFSFREYKDAVDFSIGIRQAASGVISTLVANEVANWGYQGTGPNLNAQDAWNTLVQAAIASGSFPFAFAPRDLRRWRDGNWVDEYFQDGGTFDNDPVGETINIAHEIDWSDSPEAAEYEDLDRRFLMIHVEPFDDSVPEMAPTQPITKDSLDAFRLATTYFPAVLEESENTGLRGIVAINGRIDDRSKFLKMAADLVQSGSAAAIPDDVMKALARFRGLEAKLDFFRQNLIPDLENTDPNIFPQVSSLTDPQKAAFQDLALAYDFATDIADKVKLKPVVIAPEKRLSGSGFYFFGGFLVQALRERDYAQGMYDAYQAWKAISQAGDFVLDPAVPDQPAAADDILRANQVQYQKEITDTLIPRVNTIIDSFKRGLESAHGGGLADVLINAFALAIEDIVDQFLKNTGDSNNQGSS